MKLKLLYIIGIALILLNSCADPSLSKGNGYTIKATTEGTISGLNPGYISLDYHDHNVLIQNKKKELSNNMSSASKTKKELSQVPKYGVSYIQIARSTIGEANTNNFEYIIFENGKEIYRKKGKNVIAQTPSSGNGVHWWNLDIITYPKPIKNQMTVYVIDNLHKIRSKFVITKTKQ